MKRTMFDTSVYGELVKEPEVVPLIAKHIPSDFVIYGTPIIREEIRALSKEAMLDGKNKRILLLRIYDSFVKKDNHSLQITDIIEIIAHDYFVEYKKSGGSLALKEIINDFRIVACAAVHHLDIVVSEDKKSLLSSNSINAFNIVNRKNQLQNPEFISFKRFKE